MQFSRTIAPEPSKGPALLALMAHYNWRKAVMLTSSDNVYFESGLELTTQLKGAGIEVFKPAAFKHGLDDDVTRVVLGEIKRSGTR